MEAYSPSGLTTRSIFRNISPPDQRYLLSEESLFKVLSPWISEEASVKTCANPGQYRGLAVKKARSIAEKYKRIAING